MVKFTKNGSTAVTAAIKLARAYTKRFDIKVLGYPFFFMTTGLLVQQH